MERTARQLEATAAWWQARAEAGLVVPDLEGYPELIAGKVAILRERARTAGAKHDERRFNADSLTLAERAKLRVLARAERAA